MDSRNIAATGTASNTTTAPLRSQAAAISNDRQQRRARLQGVLDLKIPALVTAGYVPAVNWRTDTTTSADDSHPDSGITTTAAPHGKSDSRNKKTARFQSVAMAEPRARVARHKGQMNFPAELRLLLLAYGDPSPHPSFPSEPLPETVRVLDEIVTDFILEMCHSAAQYARTARRQKIKVDDFRFALRRDPNKLGRVQELLRMERELKEARKAFDQNDDQVAVGLKEVAAKKGLEDLAESVAADEAEGAVGSGRKGGRGRGKRGGRRGSDATEGTVSKRRKVVH